MLLFDVYRRLLLIICVTYAAVRLVQGISRWCRQLSGRERYVRVMRGYVTVLLVSTRIRRFWAELLQIVVLLALLVATLYAHKYVM